VSYSHADDDTVAYGDDDDDVGDHLVERFLPIDVEPGLTLLLWVDDLMCANCGDREIRAEKLRAKGGGEDQLTPEECRFHNDRVAVLDSVQLSGCLRVQATEVRPLTLNILNPSIVNLYDNLIFESPEKL